MYSAYVRGKAELLRRDGTAAVAEFQKILDHPGVVMNSPLTPVARLGLARAYAIAGETGRSRTQFEQLMLDWKDADRDLPILAEARRQYAAVVARDSR